MKALIAMSGGVDSSVAAYLMHQAGYECIGCTMRLHDQAESGSLQDIADAGAIAERFQMPYHVFDFRDLFYEKIISKFVNCYLCGKTPNPCIECNRHMKFAKLLEQAELLGCEKFATGHYVQIAETEYGPMLKRAADLSKDQSYVLYMLTQEQLSHAVFPLGGITKQQVRELALQQGFVNAQKHDSQDICFVPDGDYVGVIEACTGKKAQPGDFVSISGEILGRHQGVIHYTIGQRKGLGIAIGKPAYVCGIDMEHNRVVLGDNADLFHTVCKVQNINWNMGAVPEQPFRCEAKIRYRHQPRPATVTFTDTDTAILEFDEPQRAITPGQAAVFYLDDLVCGGGEII